jgi:recombinational DNA repair protein RecR
MQNLPDMGEVKSKRRLFRTSEKNTKKFSHIIQTQWQNAKKMNAVSQCGHK